MQYNHDRLIVKRRPENYSLQLATERRQRRCIPDRRRQTVPRTCRSHWEGTVAEYGRLVDGTTSMAESAECRRREMSGAGSQQGTPALFHEDSGRTEHAAGM